MISTSSMWVLFILIAATIVALVFFYLYVSRIFKMPPPLGIQRQKYFWTIAFCVIGSQGLLDFTMHQSTASWIGTLTLVIIAGLGFIYWRVKKDKD